MQSVSCKIWTRVAVSISYDANHYTTGKTGNSSIGQIDLFKNHFSKIRILDII